MVVKALFALKGEISETKIEAKEPKAGTLKAESERTGPAWEEDEDLGIGPEELLEGEIGDVEGSFNLDEEEGPGDVERIEEEGVFFGGRGKAAPKKRK
jgi:hypothetical protein